MQAWLERRCRVTTDGRCAVSIISPLAFREKGPFMCLFPLPPHFSIMYLCINDLLHSLPKVTGLF